MTSPDAQLEELALVVRRLRAEVTRAQRVTLADVERWRTCVHDAELAIDELAQAVRAQASRELGR